MHWVVHLKDGPKKYDHAAVAVGHRVFSFGGYANTKDRDQIGVHVFNTVSLRWAELPPVTNRFGGRRPADVPSMRRGHTAVLIDDTIYIWGGIVSSEIEEAGGHNAIGTNPDPVAARGGKCNVLYAFDVAAAAGAQRWSKPRVSGAVPEARCLHSACAAGKAMYVFGGYQQTRCTNDVYKWDAATALWSLVHSGGSPPPASSCHSATVIGTKMFVFGGGGGVNKVYYNAVSVFDTETRCWLSTPPPPSSSPQLLPERRGEHSAFAYNRQLYIFGGHNVVLDQAINDLWRFCPRTFSWEKVEPRGKGPCSWVYMMCCCMVGDRVVLFGRYRGRCTPVDAEGGLGDEDDEVKATDDLYILDLSPSLKTLCKLAVVQCGLERSGLPNDIRWELSAMSTKSNVLSIHFKCKEL